MSVFIAIPIGMLICGIAVWSRHRLADFGAQRPRDHTGTQPVLDLHQHPSGRTECHGAIYGPLGRVASRFDGGLSW